MFSDAKIIAGEARRFETKGIPHDDAVKLANLYFYKDIVEQNPDTLKQFDTLRKQYAAVLGTDKVS